MRSEFWKYALLYALALAGLSCVIILGGEGAAEATDNAIWTVKLGAMVSIVLLVLIGKAAHRQGLLPKELDEDDD